MSSSIGDWNEAGVVGKCFLLNVQNNGTIIKINLAFTALLKKKKFIKWEFLVKVQLPSAL